MKKPIELSDKMKLYVKSMGKVFRVYAICDNDDDANEYCKKHSDAGVIATDQQGRIYVACLYETVCKSNQLIDD